MKKSTNYMIWSIVLSTAFAFSAACSGDGDSSGDGDGDGDAGGESGGDGDGDTNGDGDGDAGDGDGDAGDGDAGDGDGDAGDGDGDMNVGGQGGSMSSMCDECPDDGDPCTEDACNPETGECGIPRTGNSCDDGIFCNGADTCEEGECTGHEGDPCPETSCNEGKNACECSDKSHCQGGDLSEHKLGEDGEWGTIMVNETCEYSSFCDEECTCSYVKTTYECVMGTCEATVAPGNDSTCGARDTDGTSCDNGSELFCDGEETCEDGVCTAPGDPCLGTDNPFCNDASNTCRECEGSGDNSVGCNATQSEHCCRGTCYASDQLCISIGQNLTLQNSGNLTLQNSGNFTLQNFQTVQNFQTLP